MPRFFIDRGAIADNSICLVGDDAHHICYSLRMAAGDEIMLCDGEGTDYLCRLRVLDGTTVTADILQEMPGKSESPVCIRLYQAYPKGDKLEFIIQKAVEVGACAVVPFFSTYCIKRPAAEKTAKLVVRQNKIAQEAAGQCGRSRLPKVCAPLSFAQMLQEATEHGTALFCYEGESTRSLKEVIEARCFPKTLSLIIGSEGGFSPAEVQAAVDAGAVPIALGPRIMRCETASVYALSAISCLYEL